MFVVVLYITKDKFVRGMGYHPGFQFLVCKRHNLCTARAPSTHYLSFHGTIKSVTVIILGFDVCNVSNVVYDLYLTLCTNISFLGAVVDILMSFNW